MSQSHFKKLRSPFKDDFDFNKLKQKQNIKILKLLKNKPYYKRYLKRIGSIKIGKTTIRKSYKKPRGSKSKMSKKVRGSKNKMSKRKSKVSKKSV